MPVVLSIEKASAVLSQLDGEVGLLASLLYCTGLRIAEALQLPDKDIDFAHRALIVRSGQGGKNRVVMLPKSLHADRARGSGLKSQGLIYSATTFWLVSERLLRAPCIRPPLRIFPNAENRWTAATGCQGTVNGGRWPRAAALAGRRPGRRWRCLHLLEVMGEVAAGAQHLGASFEVNVCRFVAVAQHMADRAEVDDC